MSLPRLGDKNTCSFCLACSFLALSLFGGKGGRILKLPSFVLCGRDFLKSFPADPPPTTLPTITMKDVSLWL